MKGGFAIDPGTFLLTKIETYKELSAKPQGALGTASSKPSNSWPSSQSTLSGRGCAPGATGKRGVTLSWTLPDDRIRRA
ncbi:hypothetical protein NDU88_002809 [Pleurodeles waltl]|uniref:Uncharacterized protein n=1 Tax=Pleurodeles waltl TaxID=8319 RepID=A0AAV7UDF8_PLEWA|nr:hypothetical protein NDU88_002809 [Pleurodeles waltl]